MMMRLTDGRPGDVGGPREGRKKDAMTLARGSQEKRRKAKELRSKQEGKKSSSRQSKQRDGVPLSFASYLDHHRFYYHFYVCM